jgi:hypothetical protein
MKCLCDKKELMPLQKIKQEGQTFMMPNEPYKGIYSQEDIHVAFFKNIAINHGYKSRSLRAKLN